MTRWQSFDSFEKTNLALSAGVIGASFAFAPPVTLGVVVGVLIEAVHFRGLRAAANSLFRGVLPSGAVRGLFALRFFFLGTATAIALKLGVHPLGLVLGLSTAVPAVLIVAWRNRILMQELSASATSVLPSDDPSWDRWNIWRACEDPEPEPAEDWGVPGCDLASDDMTQVCETSAKEMRDQSKPTEGLAKDRKKDGESAR